MAQAISEDLTDPEIMAVDHYEKKRVEIIHKQVDDIKVNVTTNLRILQQQLQETGNLMSRTSNFEVFLQDLLEKSAEITEEIKALSSQFDIKNKTATTYNREMSSLTLAQRKIAEEKNKRIQDIIGFQMFLAPTFDIMNSTASSTKAIINEPPYKTVEDMENIIISLTAAQKNSEYITGQWTPFLHSAKTIYKDIFTKLQM